MEYENTRYLGKDKTSRTRLNPCSNGIRKYIYIVILVLMEYENTFI